MSVTSLLLLADGRFPDGTHAHSYGLETAVATGRVSGIGSLGDYIAGRLWASGRTDAAAARLAALEVHPDALDAAWCLRTPSAAARATARSLGRSLARTASRVVPDTAIALSDGRPPVQPIAFGLLGSALGCDPDEIARASAHGTAATLSAAGLRLLSLDPFAVAALMHRLGDDVEGVAGSAADVASADDLPCVSTPFAEIDVELQPALTARLFRS